MGRFSSGDLCDTMQSFTLLRVLALALLYAFGASAAPTRERTTSFVIIGDSTSKYEYVALHPCAHLRMLFSSLCIPRAAEAGAQDSASRRATSRP